MCRGTNSALQKRPQASKWDLDCKGDLSPRTAKSRASKCERLPSFRYPAPPPMHLSSSHDKLHYPYHHHCSKLPPSNSLRCLYTKHLTTADVTRTATGDACRTSSDSPKSRHCSRGRNPHKPQLLSHIHTHVLSSSVSAWRLLG